MGRGWTEVYSYHGPPTTLLGCAWEEDSTGIIRFFTKQIATEGFSTAFGELRCAL